MISVVVDSSVWIDFLAGKPTWQALNLRERIRRGEPLGLTDIVLTELLRGTRDENSLARLEGYLAVFEVAALRSLEDFRLAAALYRAARDTGTPIRASTACLIAAVCIREGLPLLHDDHDFDHLAAVGELAVVRLP